MSVSESKIIAAVEHYQNSITKHENNKEKILNCIHKLSKFPMTVSILQKTLVGLTINALRKYEGDVGNAAKVLVTKWKDVVRKESKDDHSEDEIDEEEEDVNNHENNHSNDSGVDNDDLEELDEEFVPKMRDKKADENHSSNKHADSKSKKDLMTNGKGEGHSSSKRSKHNDDKSNRLSGLEVSSRKKLNHESSSSKKSCQDSSDKRKSHGEKSSHKSSSSSKSKHDNRKRKHEISDESESDSNLNSSNSSDESHRSSKRRHIKLEKLESSDEKATGSDSDSCGSGSSNNSRTDKNKYGDHKQGKSSNKVNNKSSHHSSSSSKSKNDSSHKKSDSHKKSSRDETKSSNSSSKSSHVKSERPKDKDQQKSSSKDKHSKNSDHHKSKSIKTECVKIKVEKDDSKSPKSGKESQKSQSSVKVKQEKDKITVNSFEAALMGFSSPVDQSKAKLKPKSSSKSSTSPSDSKKIQSPDSTASKSSKSPGAASPEFDLFPEMKPDLDKDIVSSLPELADVYRPLPQLSESKRDKVKLLTEDEALESIMTTKNQRTKVYSGNKSSYTKVPSLFELCTRVLIDNIDLLEYTGGVPYDILKPVIERASADQLFILEHYNEYLKDDTDVHWEYHCQKDFKGKTKEDESETWRDLYLRCVEERQKKLERLTNNITRNIAESAPARKTKLAYVDSAVKPPRNVIRKQSKNGTAANSAPSSSKYDIIAKSVKGESSSSKSSESAVKVTSPAMQRAANYVNNLVKKKKAPLMQKTLQLIKGNRFKR